MPALQAALKSGGSRVLHGARLVADLRRACGARARSPAAPSSTDTTKRETTLTGAAPASESAESPAEGPHGAGGAGLRRRRRARGCGRVHLRATARRGGAATAADRRRHAPVAPDAAKAERRSPRAAGCAGEARRRPPRSRWSSRASRRAPRWSDDRRADAGRDAADADAAGGRARPEAAHREGRLTPGVARACRWCATRRCRVTLERKPKPAPSKPKASGRRRAGQALRTRWLPDGADGTSTTGIGS